MTRLRGSIGIVVAAVLALAGVALAPAPTAVADSSRPLVRSLVLGDSYSAGVGGGDYEYGPCAVSPHSYAAQWAARARSRGVNVAEPVNHACLGAVTGSFYNAQNASVSDQLGYVNDSYDIVFLTIGGNDLDFAKTAEDCLTLGSLVSQGLGCEKNFDNIGARIAGLQGTIRDILLGIADKLHAGARIVLVGYPSLVRSRPDPELDTCVAAPLLGDCSVRAGQVYEAGQALWTMQKAAVAEANNTLASDSRWAGKDLSVVPVPLVIEEFAGREPIAGPAFDSESLLWDPFDAEPFHEISNFVVPGIPYYRDKGDAMGAFASGYFHPKRGGYARMAALLDRMGGSTLFGASIADDLAVVMDSVMGKVGDTLDISASDNLPGSKVYSWDFDGDGVYDQTSTSPDIQHVYSSPISGTIRVSVTYADGVMTSEAWLKVTRDGDSFEGDDNCSSVSNEDQLDSDADGLGDACDPSTNSQAPVGTGSFGDPHMLTLDGLNYEFQAAGEFHLLKAASASLDIQARFVPVGNYASVWSAIAFRRSGVDVEVRSDLSILIDGVALPDDMNGLPDGTRISRSDGRVDFHFPGGIWLQLTSYGVGVKAPPGVSTKGLLGNNDGSPNNDLRTASGESVDPHDLRRIHERFANSWRIDDDESAFTYRDGESTATYTDLAFPATVRTLADFSAADLEEAASLCRLHGVTDGTRLDDCTFDYLVGGDVDAAAQAAVNESVSVDPTAARFSADGVLEVSFNGSVPSTFAYSNYLALTSDDEAAGPVTAAAPYEGAIAGVPRHDAATATVDLVVKGEPLAAESEVSLTLDGGTAMVVALGDSPSVVSGPSGGQVAVEGDGVAPGGAPYRKYRVVFPATHFGSAMRLRVVPTDLAQGQVLGIDNLTIALVTQPAQGFTAPLPFTTDQLNQAGGSGSLETPGAEDDYLIPISGASGDDSIFFETGCNRAVVFELRGPDGSVVPTSDSLCDHRLYERLAAGTYTLAVTSTGTATTYSYLVTHRPPPQSFTYEVGQRVESGKIAGVDTPGAGNLETTASKDVYSFSLTSDQTVVFDSLPGYTVMDGSRLKGVGSGIDYGVLTGHHEFDLPAGDYQVVVEKTGWSGAYWLESFVKPAVQSFTYEVGQRVESGKIAGVDTPGAGNLETTASKDVYSFSLTSDQTVVFDSLPGYTVMDGSRLKGVGSGIDYGVLTGHHEFDLPAGDYQVVIANVNATGGYWFESYAKPAAQSFTYEVGQRVESGKIAGVDVPGAGNLETTASKDVYSFSLTSDQVVVFDGDGWALRGSQLKSVASGEIAGPVDGHHEYALRAGSYQITVTNSTYPGSYAFTSAPKAGAQLFAYEVGQRVEPGKVAGTVVAGAGSIETTSSLDVYAFRLSQAETVVFDGDGWWTIMSTSRLVNVATGEVLGSLNDHHEYQLAAGDYQVTVGSPGNTGTYGFTSFTKPAADVFPIELASRVEAGKINGQSVAGAGSIETTASKDVYTFSLSQADTVVFDGDAWWTIMSTSRLVNAATGESLGSLEGHHEYALGAGDYQVTVGSPGNTGTYWFTSFAKPAPQVFTYVVGQRVESGSIGGVATAGAGNLETTASKDVYTFSLPTGQSVVFDADSSTIMSASRLVNVATGEVLGSLDGHHEYALGAGDYQVTVGSPGNTGTYWFTSFAKPAPQMFTYVVGQRVESGSIGGVATAGAGNLETTTSKDVYTFSLAADQTVVFDAEGTRGSFAGSKLVRLSDGVVVGTVCDHHEYQLAAGDYRIDVETTGVTGGYWFTSFAKPAPQVFSYVVGQRVENGSIGGVATAGAGNLETTTSKDVYTFSLAADQTVVFDAEGTRGSFAGSKLVRLSDGVVVGTVCDHHEYQLAAGDYRIDVETTGVTGGYWFTSYVNAPTGTILTKWNSSGGASGSLGTPSGATVCDGGGVCWQDFAGGQIMSYDGSAWTTVDGARAYWMAAGGPSSSMGMPTSDWIGLRDGGGAQILQHATIYQVPGEGVFSVAPPIRDTWGSAGYEGGSLGYPVSDAQCDAGSGVCWQTFEHGQIMSARGGAWITSADIRSYWIGAGGASGPLGLPTSGLIGLRDGGSAQIFQNGTVYTVPDHGTFAVYPPIRSTWGAANYETGALGYPISDEKCDAGSGVCWQTFEHGQIMSARGGAWITSADIRSYWIGAGGASGPLGLPTSGLIGLRDGGSAQIFQNGTVYTVPDHGTFAVYPPIRSTWGAANYETGALGYPISDEKCDADSGVCWQTFEHSQIMRIGNNLWTTTDLTRKRWLADGGPTGPLGNPTASVGAIAGGTKQTFEHGAIFRSDGGDAFAVVAPIWAPYLDAGLQASSYGYPTSDQKCEGDVCWQSFQSGQIMSYDGEAWTTSDAVRTRWVADGGPTGPLGKPTASVGAVAGGTKQTFEHGAIFRSDGGDAFAVVAPIWAPYLDAGLQASSYGYPVEAMDCTAALCTQAFTGGSISADR